MITTNDKVKCRQYVSFEELNSECFSFKFSSKFTFNCDFQIDKKINNVKEDSKRKTDSNFDFS